MSRIPLPSSTRSPLKPPSTVTKTRVAAPGTPSRTRAISTRSGTPTKSASSASTAQDSAPPPLSIKEAIALRRAEAKKAQAKSNIATNDFISLEDASPFPSKAADDEDILGRWPVTETIERARSTGSLNLATRSLPCIPSALFEIHLGIKPDPLKSVPNEPVLPPSAPPDAPRRGGKRDTPAWFEAQDLQILKLWNNEIIEIQHEISLFGSLKTIDLHKNKLENVPASFADLTALTTLDLSHNSLTSLPTNLFALPELTTLNLSHNSLTALAFNAPFASPSNGTRQRQAGGGSFFTPTVTRATSPLPRLLVLDASHNKLTANAIDLEMPRTLTKVILSANPLGINETRCRSLLQVLGALPKLKELRLENADIGDDAFPPALFTSSPFPNIRILDLGETKVTPEAAKEALKGIKQEVSFDLTTEDPPEGIARIIVGKKVVKEAWEVELERREKIRRAKLADFGDGWDAPLGSTTQSKSRTTRTEANGAQVVAATRAKLPVEVVKESWELEAEQGLLTEGGKRRARAAAAAAAASEAKPQTGLGVGKPSTAGHSPKSTTSGLSLASPQYFSQTTQTLTLPPSSPPSKTFAHTRAFSLAAPSSLFISSSRPEDLVVPSPTLPLSVIVTQPFAQTLKVLVLVNRRMDKSFSLPSIPEGHGGFLPNLEELNLEGCSLADLVSVTYANEASGTVTPPRSTAMILPLIAKLFPSLRTLDLSGNALTSLSLTAEALSSLILATAERKGLKHLRLRGNRLTELDGFQGLAESFKGNRDVPGWHLDELDIRDNEIGKLPPEVGLLPMDVFLVDGNTFRIPPRRVWEREGTKGLLSWLRGRMD
ncbi:Leucine-rich repeat-containing protein 40 [Hypsizygus marmoreus]|uniref:Leucine-rich repeat-containing protein 40 n=1 Tax=Hypsizygus marmoreus TaxID=39966 RepID=A0A369K1T2_HYPMA|nr:Leucine-rich repeat-containing protein 40 [Hypsizygus marmoreus]